MLKICHLGFCQREYLEYFPKGIFVKNASKNMLKICHLVCCQKEYLEYFPKRIFVKNASKNMLKICHLGFCQREYLEYFPKGIFVKNASKNMLKICHLVCCQKERRGKICRGCQREPATLKLNTVNCKIEYLRLKTGETCQLLIEKMIISDLIEFNNSLISYKFV